MEPVKYTHEQAMKLLKATKLEDRILPPDELKSIQKDVARAVVSICSKGGRGVLVPGNLILTAAHCVNWSCDGGMVLGERFIETIRIEERELKMQPLAVEPVHDIAVLGPAEFEDHEGDCVFENFCQNTKPASLCLTEFEPEHDFNVYIYGLNGEWIAGSAIDRSGNAATVSIESDKEIIGGMSGGPVINGLGQLIGVISNFFSVSDAENHRRTVMTVARPNVALPVWIVNQIMDSM